MFCCSYTKVLSKNGSKKFFGNSNKLNNFVNRRHIWREKKKKKNPSTERYMRFSELIEISYKNFLSSLFSQVILVYYIYTVNYSSIV